MSTLIDKIIHPFGRPQHLVVSAANGVGGDTYFIYLDRYYLGCLHFTSTGWRVSLQHDGKLPKIYCDAILDKAERSACLD